MPSYNATYTSNGTVQPAILSFSKDKAVIRFHTPEGERTVFWFYHEIKQRESNRAVFTYTAYPPQSLELLERTLADTFASLIGKQKNRHTKLRHRTALVLFGTLITAIAVTYFFILPWVATALAARVPEAYEKKLGDEMFAAMQQDFVIDEAQSAYTTAFFDALQIPSAYNITITVVKSDVANAFALPGGHIIIYNKLLNSLTSYPQLAALLAHEFVHIQNRHSLKALFRQASTHLVFAALLGDAGALGTSVLNHADNLKSLSYSRSLEREADNDGLKLLQERKINGAGFIALFKILQNEPGTQPAEWISSHPNLETRIRNIQQQQKAQLHNVVTNTTLQQLFVKIKAAD